MLNVVCRWCIEWRRWRACCVGFISSKSHERVTPVSSSSANSSPSTRYSHLVASAVLRGEEVWWSPDRIFGMKCQNNCVVEHNKLPRATRPRRRCVWSSSTPLRRHEPYPSAACHVYYRWQLSLLSRCMPHESGILFPMTSFPPNRCQPSKDS